MLWLSLSVGSYRQCPTGVCARISDQLTHLFCNGDVLLVLTLKLPQLAPAGVLLCLSGVGVFLTFEPEAKPIHDSLHPDSAMRWFLQQVSPIWNLNEIH